ncbi:hypothetical protein DFH28DRAFT_951675 [Melampsora americana]|nr:hypothetical protein DFH28DRAFT_951675 [Melampsora americana]
MSHTKPQLCDLPLEVIQKIIGLIVEDSKKLSPDQREKAIFERWSRAKFIHPPGNQTAYINCLHDQVPILNTIQSLCAVNRFLYQACRPFLWDKLVFPSRYSIPISFWTEVILPKHGQFVEHIAIQLSPECTLSSRKSSPPNYPPEQTLLFPSNVIARMDPQHSWNRPIKPFSPQTINKIFSLCPNIRTILFDATALKGEYLETPQLTQLLANLISFTRNLRNVKSMTFENRRPHRLPEECLAGLISQLPSLESLNVSGFTSCLKTNPKMTLGWNLSRSRIYKLRISDIEGFDRSYLDHPWTHSLKELYFSSCPNLILRDLRPFLEHIAPNLETLWIGTSFSDREEAGEAEGTDGDWVDEVYFDLPKLATLCIMGPDCESRISKFKNCRKINNLNLESTATFDWDEMTEYVSHSWPELKSIRLQIFVHPSESKSLNAEEQAFSDCCSTLNISAHIAKMSYALNPSISPFVGPINVMIGNESFTI